MSVSGLKIVSVYDPVTGTVVQLNKIAPEGEFKKEPLSSENTKGNQEYAGDDSSFEFLALDYTGYDQLETWMKNSTPVRLVTYGLEDHILWYEDSLITVKKSFGFKTGNRNGFTVKIAKTGGEHKIYVGKNILQAATGWKDANGDYQADGFSISGSSERAPEFSNNLQKLTLITEGSVNMLTQVVYPISGVDLSYFINKGANNDCSYDHELIEKNFAGGMLTDNVYPDNTVHNIKTSANLYTLICTIVSALNLADADVIEQYVPYLGVKQSAISVVNY